eukprot:Pgem_evm1s20007
MKLNKKIFVYQWQVRQDNFEEVFHVFGLEYKNQEWSDCCIQINGFQPNFYLEVMESQKLSDNVLTEQIQNTIGRNCLDIKLVQRQKLYYNQYKFRNSIEEIEKVKFWHVTCQSMSSIYKFRNAVFGKRTREDGTQESLNVHDIEDKNSGYTFEVKTSMNDDSVV